MLIRLSWYVVLLDDFLPCPPNGGELIVSLTDNKYVFFGSSSRDVSSSLDMICIFAALF